jgi:hypothetical protein
VQHAHDWLTALLYRRDALLEIEDVSTELSGCAGWIVGFGG